MSCSSHDGCLRTAEAVRADLRAACETLRAGPGRGTADWPADARAAWEREQERIDESVGEITALLEILDEALLPPDPTARARWRPGAAAS